MQSLGSWGRDSPKNKNNRERRVGKIALKLKQAIRLDSIPLPKAVYTEEGYLQDKPVLTGTGIFEYRNVDGSIRRELRLPEDVFDKKSLKSYKGKPIIITHDAGLVTKSNVHDEQIGTILSEGYRSGDNVRAEIIIHDVNEMEAAGLKELSLGYNLDLDETPGVWNGERYDAIQRNIRINHLALVREARAGEKARLNIDSRDSDSISILRGGKAMKKKTVNSTRKNVRAHRNDGILTPEELANAIEEYKAKHAKKNSENIPVEEEQAEDEDDIQETEKVPAVNVTEMDDEEIVETVDDIKQRSDDNDEDVQTLLDIIDTLLAERDFNQGNSDCKTGCDEDDVAVPPADETEEDEDDVGEPQETEEDDDDVVEPEAESEEDDDDEIDPNAETAGDDEENGLEEDDDDEVIPARNEAENKAMNADSIDRMVRQRVQIGLVGRSINMDGLENMSLKRAKKKIIKAVRPSMNLDGKSNAYIDAMYDCAVADIKKKNKKGVSYQKKQMFNGDSCGYGMEGKKSSDMARERMIKRQMKHTKR